MIIAEHVFKTAINITAIIEILIAVFHSTKISERVTLKKIETKLLLQIIFHV